MGKKYENGLEIKIKIRDEWGFIVDRTLSLIGDKDISIYREGDTPFNWVGNINGVVISIPQESIHISPSTYDFELPKFIITRKEEIVEEIKKYLNHLYD